MISKTKSKKRSYGDIVIIRSYGTKAKSFEIVRGTGNYEDIINNNIGPGFENWALSIIEGNSLPLIK